MISEILKDSTCTFQVLESQKVVIINGDITAKTLKEINKAGYRVNIVGTIKFEN